VTPRSLWQKSHPIQSKGADDAEHSMGAMYANGTGVARDDAEAKRWYERAAAKGLELSKRNLALLRQGEK